MKLILKNVRCYLDKEFDFGPSGLCLITGPSGVGKSSILTSIHFVLYGKGTKIISYGKTSCKAILEIGDTIITRTKKPNRLVVFSDGKETEDEGGQEIINRIFGTSFDVTGYIAQNAYSSFIMMSPIDKLSFLERFSFGDVDLGKIKGRCKNSIKSRNDSLIALSANLEMAKKVLSETVKPEKVSYPFPKKVTDKYMDNEEIKLKNCLTLLKRGRKNLEDLISEDHSLQMEKALVERAKKDLEKMRERIVSLENDKGDDYSDLALYEKLLYKKTYWRKYRQLHQKYTTDKDRLEKMIETDKKEREEKILSLSDGLWKEYTKEETEESLEILQTNMEDITRLNIIENRLSEIGSIDPIDPLREEIALLEKEERLLSTEIETANNSYTCPSCETRLRLCDDALQIVGGETIDVSLKEERLTNIIHTLKTKKKMCEKIQSRLAESVRLNLEKEKILKAYADEVEIPSLESIEENQKFFKDYLTTELSKEKTIKELKGAKPKFLQGFADEVSGTKIKLDKMNTGDVSDDEEDRYTEDELHSLISDEKSRLSKKSEIEKQLSYLREEEKKNLFLINSFTPSTKDYSTLIKEEKERIEEYEKKIIIHETNVKNIQKYRRYFSELKNYKEWKDKVESLTKEEEVLRKSLAAATSLREKILEAESIAMVNIIESINMHSQEYLDLFFPTDPISVRLTTFKESKNSLAKPQINILIDYKGMEADLTMLSGGEVSRVVLAFTLALGEIFNTPLFLLDECTASLDAELVSVVIDGVRKNFSDRLVLIIAHQCVSGIFDREIKI